MGIEFRFRSLSYCLSCSVGARTGFGSNRLNICEYPSPYGCGFFLVNNSFLCVYHRVGDDLICSHHPYLSLRHLIHQSPRYQAKLLTDTENAPAVHAIAAARII
jgi:hypothetical protein